MSAPDDFLYRETALCRFPDPEEREALQRFGSLVLAWAVGAEHSEEGKATQTGSSLAAVAADLRHLSVYLRAVVDEVEGNVVEAAEVGFESAAPAGAAGDLTAEEARPHLAALGRFLADRPGPTPRPATRRWVGLSVR